MDMTGHAQGGNYLAKDAMPETGMLLTVREILMDKIGDDGEKPVLFFVESPTVKPMVLNKTNINIMAEIFSSMDSKQWEGKKVVVYHDPNVMFGAERVGGLRIRAPKAPAQTGEAVAPAQVHHPMGSAAPGEKGAPDFDDDIPF